MGYKIIHGFYEDDPMIQQLIIEGINEMVQEATYPSEGLELLVTDQDHIIYAVSEADEDVVGVLCYRIVPKQYAEITLLYVEPSSRKQHLASSMMGLLDQVLEKQRLPRKVTSVHAANTVARSVLDKLGFSNEVIRMESRKS